jgi:hypothetical protein
MEQTCDSEMAFLVLSKAEIQTSLGNIVFQPLNH